ncbi:ABC transporter [Comamonas testosteroni]|uniref:ABC transporter n=1 Tax=Comamonas testosteroni TaxID=285 RepID=A0A0L7MQF0_COMTE|nr:ABC transporter ATP-binding protein [Comamonas testosteroni]KOC24184.1 ABC transporter [Comamonas testosteroni]KWT68031.1 Vitamin B12 ABC transporter, ATPase component BtuD [Comamonas testosteroni]
MSSKIETGSALATEALSVHLGEREVLRQISLRIPEGRWTAIVGPNGAGKSTLLRAMAGMRAANQRQSGAVLLQGRELGDWNSRERAKALAWLGQNQPVAADMAVYDVVMLGRLPHQGWLAPASKADRKAVEQALRQTHAWDWRQRSVGQLSGGERQRVLLARALAVQARTLLMDEPLANLDPPHQTDWMLMARSLVQQGATLVSVLHELSFALLADEMVVMHAGCITHQGACSDPATHAALEAVFDRRIQVRELDGLWLALPRLS